MTYNCEICGNPVDPDDPRSVSIEYYNLIPEYTEEYGFCEKHAPAGDELDAVKQRIKQGLDPTDFSENRI